MTPEQLKSLAEFRRLCAEFEPALTRFLDESDRLSQAVFGRTVPAARRAAGELPTFIRNNAAVAERA
jgi:hypothetical protein